MAACPVFGVTLVAFCVVAAYGVWGPNRTAPNGGRMAILELGVSFTSRLSIHGFFLAALLVMGVAWKLPVLLAVDLVLIGAEWPLARLVRARGRSATTLPEEPPTGRPAPAPAVANLPAELP